MALKIWGLVSAMGVLA
uniref:Uncharacterized protein n=1 Tax=Arundo donax TaxID=35708 RepID=A0A0A9BVM8_ARUDO